MALKETPHVAGGVTTYHKDGYALNLTDSSTHDDILPWEEEQRRINHKTSLSNQQEHLGTAKVKPYLSDIWSGDLTLKLRIV